MSIFEMSIVANPILLVLMLATSGSLKKFFAKVWVVDLIIGISIICYHNYFQIPYVY